MIDSSEISDLLNLIDPNKIWVYQPTKIVFVCGGQTDATGTDDPLTMRDAFMRVAYSHPFNHHQHMLAEELNGFFPDGNYKDLLQFEADIAQISSMILLFSESFGSAAELGAFSITSAISEKLLVIINNDEYEERSFIKLGPIKSIENEYGEGAVCVIHLPSIGAATNKNLAGLNIEAFKEIVFEAMQNRERSIENKKTFNPKNSGHMIKVITGLIQWYGALTKLEIEVALLCLNIKYSSDRVDDYLLCAKFANWITARRRGTRTFYLAKNSPNSASSFTSRDPNKKLNKSFWSLRIREFWKKNDLTRFNTIVDLLEE